MMIDAGDLVWRQHEIRKLLQRRSERAWAVDGDPVREVGGILSSASTHQGLTSRYFICSFAVTRPCLSAALFNFAKSRLYPAGAVLGLHHVACAAGQNAKKNVHKEVGEKQSDIAMKSGNETEHCVPLTEMCMFGRSLPTIHPPMSHYRRLRAACAEGRESFVRMRADAAWSPTMKRVGSSAKE